jgi:exportin-5
MKTHNFANRKQFVEILLLGCPSTLYLTHVAPIVRPLFEHIEYRLQKNWDPVLNPSAESFSRPLTSSDCIAATALAARGGEEWFTAFYGRGGLFVGDLDMTTAEAAVEKSRVEVSRTFSDTLQAALALKGDWVS